MKVYVFGNQDQACDNQPFAAAQRPVPGVEFIPVEPNADLPFSGPESVVLMDTVAGIDNITLLTENDLDKLVVSRSVTAHDFDLGFQLKLWKKLGRLKKITIIGLPQTGELDYDRIHSILRKLVEQDMQGS